MPYEVLHRRSLSSFGLPPTPLSLFPEEFRSATEKQVEFWRAESASDHCGTKSLLLMSRSKSIASSPLEKNRPMGGNYVEGLEPPQSYLFKDPKTTTGLENHLREAEETAGLSMSSWRTADQVSRSRSNAYVQRSSLFAERNKLDGNGFHYENSLFSSSLSDVLDKRLRFSSDGAYFSQSVNTNSNLDEDKPFESSKEIEAQTIGNLLPDDDDLLSGVINDFENIARPSSDDDIEEDLFYSGGGMELETDDISHSKGCGSFSDCQLGVSNGLFGSNHRYGAGPSRTLLVRNIDSSLEDADLRVLFEQYGDLHMLNATGKHCGFIMVSYYDIRAAQNARRALQNRSLKHQKLDIHFSFPKDNSSEKDAGLLVVFNRDSSVSNGDMHQIFGVYGEIKEIHDVPHKRHYKIIEFFDIRAAEAALVASNKNDIAGKRIKVLPSRLEGARQCFMQQVCQEREQDKYSGYRPGSPPDKLASEHYGSIPLMANASNVLDNVGIKGLHSAVQALSRQYMDSTFPELSSSLHGLSSSVIHSNQSGPGELSHSLGQMNFSSQCMPSIHPHSLPDYNGEIATGIPYNSSSTIPTMGIDFNIRPVGGINNGHMHSALGGLVNHTFEPKSGFRVPGNGSSCYGHQFAWNNASEHSPGSMVWGNSPSFLSSIPARPPPEIHGLPRAPSHMVSAVIPLNQHPVGSAPTVDLSLWDTRHACRGDSIEIPAFHHGSLGSMGFPGNSPMHPQELNRNMYPHAGGNCMDPSISSSHAGMPSAHQRRHTFHARNPTFPVASSYDTSNDRVRSRRSDQGSNQIDNKKQFELDIDRIIRGEDSRTTLMIKNIPNKYTSKMLLATIDEHHRGTYDFIYLPIDFKNKCNVGYAFINMTKPEHIIPFYQTLNGKKWEKFNSEKVATLAYARIQGRAALIAHFQNSSLMNEDKRCRPILFHSEGPNAGDQEPFPVGVNIQSRPGKSRTACHEETREGSPSNSANGDDSSNASDSSLGSTNGSE